MKSMKRFVPVLVLWVPSGGTNKDETPSVSSQLRLEELSRFYQRKAKDREVMCLFTGEKTRQSGNMPQGDSLAVYAAQKMGIPGEYAVAINATPFEACRHIEARYPNAEIRLFIEAPFATRFLDMCRVASPAMVRRMSFCICAVPEEYETAYSNDYVRCNAAVYYGWLTYKALKLRRTSLLEMLGKAVWHNVCAAWHVNPAQLVYFYINKSMVQMPQKAWKKRLIAVVHGRIRPDLKG